MRPFVRFILLAGTQMVLTFIAWGMGEPFPFLTLTICLLVSGWVAYKKSAYAYAAWIVCTIAHVSLLETATRL